MNKNPVASATTLWIAGFALLGFLLWKSGAWDEKHPAAKEVEVKRWEDQQRKNKLDKDIRDASTEAYGK